MGEIRIVGPGKTRGYPYPVCKKRIVGPGKHPVCKKVNFSVCDHYVSRIASVSTYLARRICPIHYS